MLRVPVDLLVAGDQLVLDGRGPDVPGLLGVVEKGRAAAPAERIGVVDLLGFEEQAAGFQVFEDERVGRFDEFAGEGIGAGDFALPGRPGARSRARILMPAS